MQVGSVDYNTSIVQVGSVNYNICTECTGIAEVCSTCWLLPSMTLMHLTFWEQKFWKYGNKNENEERKRLIVNGQQVRKMEKPNIIQHFSLNFFCHFRCLPSYRRQDCLRERLSDGRNHRGPLHLYGGKWWVSYIIRDTEYTSRNRMYFTVCM